MKKVNLWFPMIPDKWGYELTYTVPIQFCYNARPTLFRSLLSAFFMFW